MKAVSCAFALAWLAATAVHAQSLPEPAPAAPVALADVLPRTVYSAPPAAAKRSYPHVYGGNLAANPNDRAFNGLYRTDPRLQMGVAITPAIAFEAGYVNLLDRGFHPIDERDPEDTSGAIGVKGFNAHMALKFTQPLADGLSAYGKLGVARSEQRRGKFQGVDTGLYTGVGAQYQVSERVTLDGSFENHGRAAERFNNGTNSSSKVRANLNLGF